MAEEKDPNAGKQHVSIVICGHVDAGKSTTTGRLIFDLGGIPPRDIEKLKEEAKILGKDNFYFAFYMDKSKEERARGVTIACTTKEFYTDSYHYTIIDAPGHRDFIKNMITGASQADVALLMVPADGNFTAAIQKGNHKAGKVQGQTRQHARLIHLLGVKQLVVGVNKMDCDVAGYKEERFVEIRNEMEHMLSMVGWKDWIACKAVPILPLSGWMGDNLLKASDNMKWWTGITINIFKKQKVNMKKFKAKKFKELKVTCLLDCLEKMVKTPAREDSKPFRVPVSGVYKIKGVGDVITGRVEQGKLEPGAVVKFLPTHTKSKACTGKVFTVEMHHKAVPAAGSGDNVGLNVKGLDKVNMPRVGDIMVDEKEEYLKACENFTAKVSVLDHPGKLKPGYTPIAFIRTNRAAVKMTKIHWKVSTKNNQVIKSETPKDISAKEMGEITFEPQQPFVVDTFKSCEGLGRVAIMEGNGVVMLGTVIDVKFKED